MISPSPPSQPGRSRVLVAEDLDTDFLLIDRHLRKQCPGCEIVRAGTRAELVDTLRQHWDLIITDYHLLDIQEDELLATIAAAQPQTRCILWSGSMTDLVDLDLPGNVICSLQKGDYAGLNATLANLCI